MATGFLSLQFPQLQFHWPSYTCLHMFKGIKQARLRNDSVVETIRQGLFKKIFYFFIIIHERHRMRERERQRHRQREKQAPCREPDVGLNPWSPGSHLGLQAVLNRCATGAALAVGS